MSVVTEDTAAWAMDVAEALIQQHTYGGFCFELPPFERSA